MDTRSYRIMDRGSVGNNVAFPLPIVDRGCGFSRNIMDIIMGIDENGKHTKAVKSGKHNEEYTWHRLDLCAHELYLVDYVTTDTFFCNPQFNTSPTLVVNIFQNAIVPDQNALKSTDVKAPR